MQGLVFRNMEELNKKIADEGVGACEEYYQ